MFQYAELLLIKQHQE